MQQILLKTVWQWKDIQSLNFKDTNIAKTISLIIRRKRTNGECVTPNYMVWGTRDNHASPEATLSSVYTMSVKT